MPIPSNSLSHFAVRAKTNGEPAQEKKRGEGKKKKGEEGERGEKRKDDEEKRRARGREKRRGVCKRKG